MAERLVLPKTGLPVLARRLSPMTVMLTSEAFGRYDPKASRTDAVEYANLVIHTVQQILVQPRLALNPGPDEIDPNWVPQEDSDYLLKWGMGLIGADGADLAQAFRDERNTVPAARADGGGLRDAAQQLCRDIEPNGGVQV